MNKKIYVLLLLFSFLSVSHIDGFDDEKSDKLMTYYIKNDDAQFKDLLQEIASNTKSSAELYNELQNLSNKFHDFHDFYGKKRDKRIKWAQKNLLNAFFYGIATSLSLFTTITHVTGQSDSTTKIIGGVLGLSMSSFFGWLAKAHLMSSVQEYTYFPKLLRKNSKFWSIVEKLKQTTAMQMEVHIPAVDDAKLQVD